MNSRLLFILAFAIGIASLSGCSTTYASKQECERAEAAYRGRAIGFLVASAISDTGRRVVRENGQTVTKINNHGNWPLLGLGTLIGHSVGTALHEQSTDNVLVHPQPHTGDWLGRCKTTGG